MRRVFPHGARTPAGDGAGESFELLGAAFDSTGRGPAGVGELDLLGFERALAGLSGSVDEAAAGRGVWLSRLRAGLVAFLAFFDDEPVDGRALLFARCPRDGALAFRCEQRLLGVLSGLFDDGAPQALGELTPQPQLTSELLAGGILALVRERVLGEEAGALVELVPALMAFVVGPYLGEAAARAELSGTPAPAGEQAPPEPIASHGERLAMRLTRRTVLVLRAIGAAPRSSNREIARRAGLSDEGQTSRLLGRLQARGLVENLGAGAALGEPNAWLLSANGRRALASAGAATHAGRPARRGDVAGGGCAA